MEIGKTQEICGWGTRYRRILFWMHEIWYSKEAHSWGCQGSKLDLVVWSLEGSYDLEILIKERADSMTIVFKAMDG